MLVLPRKDYKMDISDYMTFYTCQHMHSFFVYTAETTNVMYFGIPVKRSSKICYIKLIHTLYIRQQLLLVRSYKGMKGFENCIVITDCKKPRGKTEIG